MHGETNMEAKRKAKPRTDRELVTIYQKEIGPEKYKAANELWDKYKLFVSKMKGELKRICKDNEIRMPDIFREYQNRAYEKFIHQLDGINMERVQHHKNWTISIRLHGYLQSMNRDLINASYKKYLREEPEAPVVQDNKESKHLKNTDVAGISLKRRFVEEDIYLETGRKVLRDALKRLDRTLTKEEALMLNMKYKGYHNNEVVEALGIDTNKLKAHLSQIQSRLNEFIIIVGNEMGVETSFSEINEMFTYPSLRAAYRDSFKKKKENHQED